MASAWATAEANAVAEAGTGTVEGAGTAGTVGMPADAEAVAMAWLRVGLICRQETVPCSRPILRQGRLVAECFVQISRSDVGSQSLTADAIAVAVAVEVARAPVLTPEAWACSRSMMA